MLKSCACTSFKSQKETIKQFKWLSNSKIKRQKVKHPKYTKDLINI